MTTPPSPLPPGSTIGILGGGQLGRMTALAAAALGYRTHIFCPEPDAPALQVTPYATLASYRDEAALAAFAGRIDAATFEFENVPRRAVELLETLVPMRPGARVLGICQDRLEEKGFCRAQGIATTAYAAVLARTDLDAAVAEIGTPSVLKSTRMGYDGHGQAAVRTPAEAGAAWDRIGGGPAILERFVDFERELSVIVARGPDGGVACYPAVENQHENHILARTIAPAAVTPALAAEAERIGRTLATALDLVGLLAVELFLTRDGRLLVNELAPRPHNSGHWTIEACATSQFAQAVRAVAGLALGSTERLADAEMTNLLGAAADDWAALLAEPGAHLHLYGKAQARPGRKMGHVTRLKARRS